MDPRAVRYYLAVAGEGTFSRAASRLGVSQPAVSQGVALLEEEVGARLFDRDARGARLTPEGALLLEPARRALEDFEALRHVLDRSRGNVRGRLEIGTTDAASIYVLPRVYRAFRQKHPEADLSVRVEGTRPLLRQLGERSVELAIVSLGVGDISADLPGVRFLAEPLHREELVFVLSPRHPLGARKRLSLEELARSPLITFKRDSITRQAVAAQFASAGLEIDVAMEMSSPEAIKKLVEVGLGASVLPRRAVAAELRSGALVAPVVPGGKMHRTLGIVRDARRTLTPAADAFLRLVERVRNVPAASSEPVPPGG